MSQAKHRGPIDLWYTRCGAATASALAIRKNWLQEEFAKGGTVLHSLRDSDSLETRNSHYHHRQTGVFREGGNIPPIWAMGSGGYLEQDFDVRKDWIVGAPLQKAADLLARELSAQSAAA
jgi:hypothetical protein